ncbi:tetratricopeptide repeat protein [Arsukibacterium sp.]|uniref:protein kinase domain-containing protein n=1 Tax=Arsukibacterium sp. TaxID=1977258 RepID=UPI00356840CC
MFFRGTLLVNAIDVTQALPSVTGFNVGDVLVARFELIRLLGNGSNGSVFLADDLHLGCQVALKILHKQALEETAAVDKVRQEILLARTITHPNVIRVHDFYLTAECAFFTMDYIDGKSLAQVNLADSTNAEYIAQKLGSQLIDAVEAIHQQGIIHCDINPQNILVDDKQRLYLLDLGLAGAITELTHQCCTPAYSAPEILQNASHTKQSDYYAIASTLFQLLTNQLPFNQTELAGQLTAKLHSQVSLSHIEKHFPRWRAFFVQNLAVYPQQRCQNASELRQLWLNPNETSRMSGGMKLSISVLSAVLLSVLLWFVVSEWPTEPGTEQSTSPSLAAPMALAILPAAIQQQDAQHRAIANLVEQVINEQLRSRNIRVIPFERVATTLQHLGLSQPLTDKQLQDLSSLLGADIVLAKQLTLLNNNVEIAFELKDMRQPLMPLLWSARQAVVLDNISGATVEQVNNMLLALQTRETPGVTNAAILPDEAQQLYQQVLLARAANSEEDYLAALKQFQQQFPQLATGFLLAAEWHEQQQNWLQAETAYAEAVKLSALNSFEYLLSSARLALLQERPAQADSHYQKLVAAKPFDTELTMEYVDFLTVQSRFSDAIGQLHQISQVDKTNPDIFLQLGKLAIRTGDINRAVDEYLLQAQVLFGRLKHKAGLADTLNAVGVAMQRQGKFAEAAPYYEQSLSLFEQMSDINGMAKASSNLGFVQFLTGDFTLSQHSLELALQYYRQVNDRYGLAVTTDYLGFLEEEKGEYRLAQGYFNDAFSIRTQLGDSWELTASLINLGYIYFVLSEFEQSQVYLKQAEQTAVANNDALNLLKVRQVLAQLKIQQGEWGQAFRLFKTSSDDAASLGLTEEKLIADAFLAKLASLQGNFSQGEQQLLAFIEQARNQQYAKAAIEFQLWLAELYQYAAQYDKAAEQIAVMASPDFYPSNNEQRQTLKLLMVQQLLAAGQTSNAQQELRQLQQQLTLQPIPRLELRAFIAQQHINFLTNLTIDTLPKEYEQIMRHHVPERLLWLELQAMLAVKDDNRELVGQLLNQALPLLRRATSYWRSFAFEYMQQYFNRTEHTVKPPGMGSMVELQRVLQHVPAQYHEAMINRENAMVQKADGQ